MIKNLIFTVLITWLLCLSVNISANETESNIPKQLQKESLTGAVWSIISSDGSYEVFSSGWAEVDKRKMENNTKMHIGSVSKVVLATGVLRLISQGKIELDSKVSTLLPNINFNNHWQQENPVTVENLLNHTAGLDDLRLWQVFSLEAKFNTPLIEAFLRDPDLLTVRSKPGERYSYSNMGYTLLAMIIESLTGEAYEEYLDLNLLKPLGMNDSSFKYIAQAGEFFDQRLAMGYSENNQPQQAMPTYLRASGQFTTTAKDMALFAKYLMGDGRIDNQVFILPKLLKNLSNASPTNATKAGLDIGHGLALAKRDRYGVLGDCHPGSIIGFRAMLCLFPEENKAFFIALNTDSETADYNSFNQILINQMDINKASRANVGVVASDISDWEGIYILQPNSITPFAWIDLVFNSVTVHWSGKALQIKPFQSSERSLIPSGGYLFSATDRETNSHVLFEDNKGTQFLSDGLYTYQKTPWLTMYSLWGSLLIGLIGLFYIFIAGSVSIVRREMSPSDELFMPFVSIIALLFPIPLFFQQSFLQMGEMTSGSLSLAIVTGLLPIGMIIGLVIGFRKQKKTIFERLNLVFISGALQWLVLLAFWGMLPFRLWV